MNNDLACALEIVLVLQLLFLALHDSLPLGRWNNLGPFRAAVPLRRRIIGTLTNALLGLLALHLSEMHAYLWLTVVQAFFLAGEIAWWWRPYFFGAGPELVARLRPNWEGTIAFLPERNGIRPNAMHCVMHGLTLIGLLLAVLLHWKFGKA
jgi:hypothetical protein